MNADAGESNRNDFRGRVTRKMLWDALFSLIEERHFDNISVKDICARSHVNRSTFYNHFESKFDLLNYGIYEIMPEEANLVAADSQRRGEASKPPSPHEAIFNYVYKYQRFFSNLFVVKGISDHVFTSMIAGTSNFLNFREQDENRPCVPLEVEALMYFGAVSTLTVWWLKNKCSTPVEDMIRYVDIVLRR